MRRLVSLFAFAALAVPAATQAQIAEIELPPSDVADDGTAAEFPADDYASADYDAPDYDDPAYGEPDYDDPTYDDRDYADPSDRAADILDDPRRQEEIADAMSDMMRALMTIRVGPIVDAARQIDPAAGADYGAIDPDATIGDIASRGDPDYEDRIDESIRSGTAMSGTMIREVARMMPVLIGVAKDLGAQADKAMRDPAPR